MSNATPDPDDFFAETRMSFGDHIEDLRRHLWRALGGFGIALVFSFFIGHLVLNFITAPVKAELQAFYNRRVQKTLQELQSGDSSLQKVNEPTPFAPLIFRKDQFLAAVAGRPAAEVNAFKQPVVREPEQAGGSTERTIWDKILGRPGEVKDKLPEGSEAIRPDNTYRLWVSHAEPLKEAGYLQQAIRIVGDFDTMATLSVQEAFMVWFKVCLVCGLVLGSPWIFWEIWSFVAAGLYPHEKKYVHYYLPVSLLLFLIGVLVCEFLVIPRAIEALLWFNEWLGLKPDLRLSEWLGFAILLPVIFGVSFQTPLVMLFLGRLGIMTADSFRSKRRIAWFAMAVFAAIITPTPDALTMLLLWVPMSLLFELGIILIRMSPRQPDLDVDVPESEEMIEV